MKDLRTWINHGGFNASINEIPLQIQGKLLYLAKRDPDSFDKLVLHGLGLRIAFQYTDIDISDKALRLYVAEARLKLVTILKYQCKYLLPKVPFFSISATVPAEQQALHDFEMIVIGQVKKPDLYLVKGGKK